MKSPALCLLSFALTTLACAADDAAQKPAPEIVFHAPFTLKLHVDKEHFYEEQFDKIPYVHNGDVYLFKGDEFGLTLDAEEKTIRAVKYQPHLEKADVTLKFTQDVKADGKAMMLLRIVNHTQRTIYLDAVMTVPGKKTIGKTSILPVAPGLSGYESWPHPIVQLVLRNIRFTE